MIFNDLSQILALDRISKFILFNILYLMGCIQWSNASNKNLHRGRPYVYSPPPTVILRCVIVRIGWFKIDSNNGLHTFLNTDCQHNKKLVLVCGLASIYLTIADEHLRGD
ncbi:MAG: hypothetical protein ABJB76_11470 [Candidatus Nitrosocosmicus sp.]